MAPKLYLNPMSQFTRAVLLTAQALDVKFEEIFVNSLTGETKDPKFMATNPQHCVPTLDDDGFILWESKAICAYLVAKYGKDDSLYPTDIQKRALVDRFLHFDTGHLITRFYLCALPVVFRGATSLDESHKAALMEGLSLLNLYLEGKKFAIGDTITIADHCLIASISSIMAAGFDLKVFQNITAWVTRCENQMKGYNVAQRELKGFGAIFKPKLEGKL